MTRVIKLLVIDDDQVDRLHLKKLLNSSGLRYELAECEDTQTALELISNQSFDCILLDYLMPGSNGLLLLKKIRDFGVKTPVVIVTSQGNESIAVELMKAGASDYIVKNLITDQSLSQVVRNMLRLSNIEREREEALWALKESESRLAEAQSIAKIGNWEFNPQGNTVHWSHEIYKIFECDPEKFSPSLENFMNRVTPEDRDQVEATTREAFQGKPFNFDFRITTTSGIKHVNSQGYAIINSDGLAEKIVGVLQDITDRKLAEQEILKARELAEHSMKVREVFLANMSHEIRTPMNAILGFTRLLFETELTKEQKGFVDAIHFSGENLLVIINEILDLSKIQSGKIVIERCEFNLQELLNGIVNLLKPKAQEKGLPLAVKISKYVPTFVKGDPVRLNQILTNLIGNAIKFTEKGRILLDVDSAGTGEKEFIIKFNVQDTGIGIQKEEQANIFENFVQASSDTTRKYGGTGLGLTIVKNLVDLQEGKIFLHSEPGQGSTFTVHLPFEMGEGNSTHASIKSVSVDGFFSTFQSASVLVVEDNAINQLLVKKVLEKSGCKTDIASNGVEALERLKLQRYDIILMDIQMPEMDGYEATRQIRNLSSPTSEIPILAMTAHAFGSDVSRCLEAGMNDFISKPFKPEVLFAKMKKHLDRSKQLKVVSLPRFNEVSIDLAPLHQLGDGDPGFLNELVLLYDEQTPAFIERLRGYLKSHNFGAIRSICHQVKSSYGILNMSELGSSLEEISRLLKTEKPAEELSAITHLVTTIISLISAITEELRRNMRKTA